MSAPAGGERRRRSRGGGGHENHERWLLPYADMITLLLALFILLYAMSSQNNAKVDALTQSIKKALNGDDSGPPAQTASPSSETSVTQGQSDKLLSSGVTVAQLQQAIGNAQRDDKEDAQLRALQKRIHDKAKEAGFASSVTTTIDRRGLVVRVVSDKVLFESGSAELRPAVMPLLAGISSTLKGIPNPVRVEGHTDSTPISDGLFTTNWELSAVRATTVVRFLMRNGLNTDVSAVGYAHKHPIAPNSSSTGRAKNRRVEVIILRRNAR